MKKRRNYMRLEMQRSIRSFCSRFVVIVFARELNVIALFLILAKIGGIKLKIGRPTRVCGASYSREGRIGSSCIGGARKGMAFCIGAIFLFWQQRHYSEEGQYLRLIYIYIEKDSKLSREQSNKNRYSYYIALVLSLEATSSSVSVSSPCASRCI